MNNKDIKLVALDMDGTLLNDELEVSEGNQKAIAAALEKDVHVVLATGRPIEMADSFAKSLNLPSYLVTVNGGEIWTTDQELIERHILGAELIEMMWNYAKEIGLNPWMASTENIYSGDRPKDFYEHQWLKFGCDTDDQSKLDKMVEYLSHYNDELELTNSLPTNIEVNPIGVNKAMALEKICKKIGITMDHVMAVGDSLNDIKMIQQAGIGVAVGNAQDAIKHVSDVVVETNTEDGVGKAIQRYVLQ